MTRMQQRRDTAANWTAANPTLASGEIGVETDTNRFKVGTGSTAWSALAYVGIVNSVAGRTGAVVLTAADVSGLATIATSGSATDLATGTVNPSRLPAATTLAAGAVTVGAGLSVSSGTVSANVTSVASRTGAITLDHRDVGNLPATLNQFTADQNDLDLGTGGIVRISSNAARNITGFVAGSAGDARLISNVGTFAITLKHQSTSSAAANRIICVSSADVTIEPNGSAVVYYDGTDSRWRAG